VDVVDHIVENFTHYRDLPTFCFAGNAKILPKSGHKQNRAAGIIVESFTGLVYRKPLTESSIGTVRQCSRKFGDCSVAVADLCRYSGTFFSCYTITSLQDMRLHEVYTSHHIIFFGSKLPIE
jgi:hypothetical protein